MVIVTAKETKVHFALHLMYFENSEKLTLSAVSWPGLGFPASGINTLSSLSLPTATFAFFGSFSSNAFV